MASVSVTRQTVVPGLHVSPTLADLRQSSNLYVFPSITIQHFVFTKNCFTLGTMSFHPTKRSRSFFLNIPKKSNKFCYAIKSTTSSAYISFTGILKSRAIR